MEKVMSRYVDDTGMLRLHYDDTGGPKAYKITYIPPGQGTENAVLIYATRFKETAGMKFFQLCTGQLSVNSWLREGVEEE